MDSKGEDKRDENSWMKFLETEGKTMIFRLFHEMFENEVIGKRGYIVLQVIEGIQILYYTIHETFKWTWNEDPAFQVFRTVVKYFQIDAYLRVGGTQLILGLNFGLFLLNILFLCLLATTLARMRRKKPLVGIEIVAVQFISVYMVLLTTVLVIPTFEVYMLSAYCNKDPVFNSGATCFKGIYLANFIVALLVMLVQLTMMGFHVYYFNDFNPLSHSPHASSDTMVKLLSTIRL